MIYVNMPMVLEITLDLINFYSQYPALRSIWAYLMCAKQYKIDTIVIGQSPYDSNIVPILGAAFSQKEGTRDTPTTDVFSRHFKDTERAKDFIRSTWKLLPMGKLFVNADYLPSSMGGGNSDIECVKRVNRTVELLLLIILSQDKHVDKVKIVCVGNLALSCGTLLSRRLRALAFSVEQISCRQPSALARIEFNNHLIGKDDKYLFCGPKVLCIFQKMIDEYKFMHLSMSKENDIINNLILNMSSQKLNPMTKMSLEQISGKMKIVCENLKIKRREINNSKDAEDIIDNLYSQVMEISKSVANLTNILLGDAYTYKVITEAQTSQLPLASREQHMSVGLDQGSEVESYAISSIGRSTATTPLSDTRGAAAKNMFKKKVVLTPIKSECHPPSVVSTSVEFEAPQSQVKTKSPSPDVTDIAAMTPNKGTTHSLKKSSSSKAANMFKPAVRKLEGDSKLSYKTTSGATPNKANSSVPLNKKLTNQYVNDIFGSYTSDQVEKKGKGDEDSE
jgi:hypothetical protein